MGVAKIYMYTEFEVPSSSESCIFSEVISEGNDLRIHKFENWVIEKVKIYLYTEFVGPRSSWSCYSLRGK